jgi:hypothetical protein
MLPGHVRSPISSYSTLNDVRSVYNVPWTRFSLRINANNLWRNYLTEWSQFFCYSLYRLPWSLSVCEKRIARISPMYVWLLSFEPGPNPKISCVIRPEPENFLCYQARTRKFSVLSGPNPKILCYQARTRKFSVLSGTNPKIFCYEARTRKFSVLSGPNPPLGPIQSQAWTRVDISIQLSTPEHRHVLVRRLSGEIRTADVQNTKQR